MDAKRTMGRGKRQSESQTRQRLHSVMLEAGLSSHTQRVYLREFDRFAAGLDRKTSLEATCADARRYLSGLKVAAVSATRYGNASAVLRLFFERVRALAWKPVSALQQRMIEDMQLHGFAAKTQKSYVRAVRGLVRYYKRSPEQIDDEQIRRYFVHLTSERKLARATVTIALCGIKFLYEKTLKRDWSLTGVPTPKRHKTLPVVLSREEVKAILSRVRELRHRACLSLIYACGLRLGEGCRVQVGDIDRARGLLRVRHGKGFKDRYVPLPAPILPLLGDGWRVHRNPTWLFPSVGRGGQGGHTSQAPMTLGSAQLAFRKALDVSGLNKKVSVHSLRHAYATHLMESQVPLRQIQEWLGHNSPAVTAVYAHLTERGTQAATGVLDTLMADIGAAR